MYGKVSEKIDVYSFGILLLELLSGRRPINAKSPKGQESLVMWVRIFTFSLSEGIKLILIVPLAHHFLVISIWVARVGVAVFD